MAKTVQYTSKYAVVYIISLCYNITDGEQLYIYDEQLVQALNTVDS